VIGKLAPGGDSAGFSSFVVGIGGMSISGLIIDIFRARQLGLPVGRDQRRTRNRRLVAGGMKTCPIPSRRSPT